MTVKMPVSASKNKKNKDSEWDDKNLKEKIKKLKDSKTEKKTFFDSLSKEDQERMKKIEEKLKNKKRDSDSSDSDSSSDSASESEKAPVKPTKLTTREWREQHNVKVEGDLDLDPFQSFADYTFPSMFNHIFENFEKPTVIQSQCWPIAASGRDMIGLAATGSGKTLAFLMPALLKILQVPKRPRFKATPLALVIAPTRELAQQIEEVCKQAVRGTSIRALCCYGGSEKFQQRRVLQGGVEIIVGTPGRLNDLLTDFHLKTVDYLVLDEADRMLDMGFLPQIEQLLKDTPADRQTLMFSATWPREVQELATKFQKNPIKVTVGNTELTGNLNVTQHFFNSEEKSKSEINQYFMDTLKSTQLDENGQPSKNLVIVFCNEKFKCDDLQYQLKVENDIDSIVLHSGKAQHQREHGLRLFRSRKVPILIATDVAARGLDINDVKAVINYGFPKNVEDYVHRIGRTGRAGKTGNAYSIINPKTDTNLRELLKILERSKQEIPSFLEDFRAKRSSQSWNRFGGNSRNGYVKKSFQGGGYRNNNRDGGFRDNNAGGGGNGGWRNNNRGEGESNGGWRNNNRGEGESNGGWRNNNRGEGESNGGWRNNNDSNGAGKWGNRDNNGGNGGWRNNNRDAGGNGGWRNNNTDSGTNGFGGKW